MAGLGRLSSTRILTILAALCLILGSWVAGLWPFQESSSSAPVVGPSHSFVPLKDHDVKQVAIIGAGPGGSSTAYHLNKFAAAHGLKLNITVFERSDYVGGRSTTVNARDDPSFPVELGASIFVEINTILKNAAEEFGLDTGGEPGEESSEKLGIWDGDELVFIQKSSNWAWWDITKILWRYGIAPIRTNNLMKSTVGKFLKLYEAPFFPFRSLSDRVLELDLLDAVTTSGEDFLAKNKIGHPFSTHIIQASTRVNYGQNLGLIHGVETMVCMAIQGTMQIRGGNWQIFDRFIKASGAALRLKTTVSGIKSNDGKYTLSSITEPSAEATEGTLTSSEDFDAVVLAAPFQFAELDIEHPSIKKMPDEIPYVTLHVTLFTSPLKLSPVKWNLHAEADGPDTVLTTLAPDDAVFGKRPDGVGKAGFWSISTLRTVVNPKTGLNEFVYKIFSPEKVDSKFLSEILGAPILDDAEKLKEGNNEFISWYYPHVWKSYPYEYPRVTFEDIELAPGLYYTSGIESFISTMETSSLMGMNIAKLIVDDYVETLNATVPGYSMEFQREQELA